MTFGPLLILSGEEVSFSATFTPSLFSLFLSFVNVPVHAIRDEGHGDGLSNQEGRRDSLSFSIVTEGEWLHLCLIISH